MTNGIIPASSSPINSDGSWKVGSQAFSQGQNRYELSTQWLRRPADERFVSLHDLRDFKETEFKESRSLNIGPKELQFHGVELNSKADMDILRVDIGDEYPNVDMTNWGFRQAGQLAGAGDALRYLRSLPGPLVADNLNWSLRHNRGDEVKAYVRKNGEVTLRALTGPKYGRVPDFEVTESVIKIAGSGRGESRWKVPGTLDWTTRVYDPNTPITMDTTTLFASDRDLFIFLVDDRNPIVIGKLPNGEPDIIYRGFYVQNSEVGKSTLKLAAFYLRATCCNRIMWGVEHFEEITIRHTSGAPARFALEAEPALLSYAEGSTNTLLAGVQKAKEAVVAKNDDDAMDFLRNRKFSKTQAERILETHEKEEGAPARSIWDIAQAVTAVARNIPNNDERVDLELQARAMLDKVA